MEDSGEIAYTPSSKGVETARAAVQLFAEGVELPEIAQRLGIPDPPEVEAGTTVRILVALVNRAGLLD